MRSISIIGVVSFLLFSTPVLAKSGPVYFKSNPIQNAPSTIYANTCFSQVNMSGPEAAAYDKIKAIIPDMFCCTVADQNRIGCLYENRDKVFALGGLLASNFDFPLAERLGEGPANPPGTLTADIPDLSQAIGSVKVSLSLIDFALTNYADLLTKVGH